jgi:SAM-dependent methyltransferase
MDDIARTNRERWNALASANVQYSQPFLDFTPEQAAEFIYRHGVLKNVGGQRVLCLASGGGQDSVAFGLLGAEVTVLDLSDVQLERDRQAADHHGLAVTTLHGDMRDLSAFAADTFDVVWQNYSINFVPSVEPVFHEVRRVLKLGGIYFLAFHNPFVEGVDDESWTGKAYEIKSLYREGEDITDTVPDWDVEQPGSATVRLPGPHEFRHTLSTVMNTLVQNGFSLLGLWEWMRSDENPEPGSWAHFTQVAPPYLMTFWKKK